MTKVILIKLKTGAWSILREDGKLAPKHTFHHGVPMREIKSWCQAKKLEVHGVLLPNWEEPIVTL